MITNLKLVPAFDDFFFVVLSNRSRLLGVVFISLRNIHQAASHAANEISSNRLTTLITYDTAQG